MKFKATVLLVSSLFLGSCSTTPGSNKSILAPSTWFSDAPLKKMQGNDQKTEEARETALRHVQILTLEQSIGLASLPSSPGLNHVIHSNRQSLLLLDQLSGPVSQKKQREVEGYMGLLFSGDTEKVEDGVSLREKRDRTVGRDSETIETLRREKQELTENLARGFERENSLANAHRSAWATFYWVLSGLVGVFILHAVLPLLANVFPVLSGLSRTVTAITSPGLTYIEKRGSRMAEALGEMLHDAKPEESEAMTASLDKYLDADHKRKVREAKNRLASK